MEARYLLDTNTIIYLRRRSPINVRESFAKLRQGEAVVSVVTYGELMYGVAKSSRKQAAIATLQEIMQMLPLIHLPGAAGAIYGEIRAELEAKGKIIGNNDLWIAAHALASGLILVTNNEREFVRVTGLKIQNWVA
ncbi:MAG TPA: type II toxin-antitoxin system VapC family toxin [Candidatus Acidoferrum sp.]|nr:type II toxin-antitoxin system VapC family toxin [Candidatus Acidoferrum sp.]